MEKLIHVTLNETELEGMLKLPKDPSGIIVFAHGSGSSRFSPRNNFVADVLFKGQLGTLLIDLLTPQEEEIYQTRFDISLLTKRLIAAINWLQENEETSCLPIGLFGASTGAAAALEAAAQLQEQIHAVVSRGGRPDLAMPVLNQVTASTLLLVGGHDFGVIELNEEAYDKLLCQKELYVVPKATHLFEEPGCLEEVAKMATLWFQNHLIFHPCTKKNP